MKKDEHQFFRVSWRGAFPKKMESEEVASGSPEVKMNPATKVLSIFKRKGKSGERKQKRR